MKCLVKQVVRDKIINGIHLTKRPTTIVWRPDPDWVGDPLSSPWVGNKIWKKDI